MFWSLQRQIFGPAEDYTWTVDATGRFCMLKTLIANSQVCKSDRQFRGSKAGYTVTAKLPPGLTAARLTFSLQRARLQLVNIHITFAACKHT